MTLNTNGNISLKFALQASLTLASLGGAFGYRIATAPCSRLNFAKTTMLDGFCEEGLSWKKTTENGKERYSATSSSGGNVTVEIDAYKSKPQQVVRIQVNTSDEGFTFQKSRRDMISKEVRTVESLIEAARLDAKFLKQLKLKAF